MTVTIEDVQVWMNLPNPSAEKRASLQRCLDAVVVYVTDHYDNKPVDNSADPADWTADIDLAIIMETARQYTRTSSPEGIETFDGLGIVRVSRFLDPDAARYMDAYLLPAIG